MTVNMPKETVAKLIDTGLELGALPSGSPVPKGMHPVIFCFGQQKAVHPSVHIGNLPFNWEYSEFIMSIPFIYLSDGMKGPFGFSTRLFLDNKTHYADAQEAIIAGWNYHLSKRAAHIDTVPTIPWGLEDHSYHIHDRANATQSLLRLAAHSTTEWKASTEFPNFAEIAAHLNDKMIGDTSVTGKDATGIFKCAKFNWHIDTAKIAAIEGTLDVDSAEGIHAGLPVQHVSFKGIDSTRWGAFRIATNWSMSMPDLPCD